MKSIDNHAASNAAMETEVAPQAKRRSYTAEYKMRIVREAEQCTKHGEMGILLRREGLYSSTVSLWRRQSEKGMISNMKNQKRGRKKKMTENDKRIQDLERENARLRKDLKQAETIIEIQKKISDLMGISQPEYKRDQS